jgi:hypothetical protein
MIRLFSLLIVALIHSTPDPEFQVMTTTAPHSSLLAAEDEYWNVATTVQFGPSEHTTEFRALWNNQGLYIRFDVRDEDPWHTYTERDAPLWEEEVVEIFLDPNRRGTHYAELEINPINVVCDLEVVSAKPKEIDLSWNLEGLEHHTAILRNKSEDVVGWTAVAYLPWEGFRSLPSTTHVALPPNPGDRWRFNVFRIERPGGRTDPEADVILAAWSPPPGRSFHVPAAFRDLVFMKD